MAIDNPKYQKMLDNLIKVCKSNIPVVDEALISKAFELSIEAHKNDMRASGEPYFTHPYEVAMIVAEEFPLDDVTIVTALLHDVVEDTEYTIDFMIREFGKEVAEIIDGVTKISGIFRGHEII